VSLRPDLLLAVRRLGMDSDGLVALSIKSPSAERMDGHARCEEWYLARLLPRVPRQPSENATGRRLSDDEAMLSVLIFGEPHRQIALLCPTWGLLTAGISRRRKSLWAWDIYPVGSLSINSKKAVDPAVTQQVQVPVEILWRPATWDDGEVMTRLNRRAGLDMISVGSRRGQDSAVASITVVAFSGWQRNPRWWLNSNRRREVRATEGIASAHGGAVPSLTGNQVPIERIHSRLFSSPSQSENDDSGN